MLVIRRRVGEAVVVAGDVQIEIIEISRTRVKLGVTAPRDVSVARKEAVAIAAENRSAAGLLIPGALDSDLVRLLGKVTGKIAQTAPGRADM